MQNRVKEAQATMDRVVQEHKQLGERLESEFADKDRRLRDSLRNQMDKLIDE